MNRSRVGRLLADRRRTKAARGGIWVWEKRNCRPINGCLSNFSRIGNCVIAGRRRECGNCIKQPAVNGCFTGWRRRRQRFDREDAGGRRYSRVYTAAGSKNGVAISHSGMTCLHERRFIATASHPGHLALHGLCCRDGHNGRHTGSSRYRNSDTANAHLRKRHNRKRRLQHDAESCP